ncbi:LAMI_0H00188g1_1 [Lachancea mirantina]|uniref:LAMI_0H00188g1_1 n=1 Tax=Lachancea mirantina TaxID=1230905 RepID=A0A1G4KDC6_9SACH|nr:LAMI_0H00188g1_1 [Lachancea mirantina]
MARKVSKHSRAARRLEAEEPEAQTLAQLPRAENADLANKIIRTASKNEKLLEDKLRKKERTQKKVGKAQKLGSSVRHIDKERLEKALKFTNRLDGKVHKAETRAKYVQRARKAGWDKTNEEIKSGLSALRGNPKEDKKTNSTSGSIDMETEDISDGIDEAEVGRANNSIKNAFELLPDDTEA